MVVVSAPSVVKVDLDEHHVAGEDQTFNGLNPSLLNADHQRPGF
jgi:hypothetical protein